MTAITRPYNWSALDDITAARMSQDYSAGLLAQDPPGCIARRAANQSITGSTFTDVSFDTEIVDNVGMFTPTSTNITIQYDGYYLAILSADWATDTTNTRVLHLLQNGVIPPGGALEVNTCTTGNSNISHTVAFSAVTGDVIKMSVWHNATTSPINLEDATLTVVRLFGPGS